MSLVDQGVKRGEEFPDIVEVQPGSRLIENKKDPTLCPALTEEGGQLDALCFATGEGIGGLTEFYIAQADVAQRFDLLEDVLLVLEKSKGFVDAHFQYIVDVLFAIGDLKDLVLESLTVAYFTREVNVGKELHFHHLFAFAFAGVAAAAVDVERKVFGLKAP